MFKHITHIQLRFVDMDAFGHLNNARYLTYYEEARIKYVDEVINYKYGWAKIGIIMARAEIDFIVPGHFKDEIKIYTRCSRIGTKSFTLEYKMVKIKDEKEILLSTANTIVVMYDYKKHGSIEVLEEWKAAIRAYEDVP